MDQTPKAFRINTPRLELMEVTADVAQAELDDAGSLARLLDVEIPSSWPPEHWEPSAIQWLINLARKYPDDRGWGAWHVILRPSAGREHAKRTLIGTAGCKGPPIADGMIEVGYGTLPEFQRRGYASEATAGVIQWALRDARVKTIAAETFPHLLPSIGVMRKLGMKHVGDGSEPGTIRYAMTREEFTLPV